MHSQIFFIDDEPHIRDAVSQALLLEGLDVTCLPNAVEALRVIDVDKPALIITDIHMPVMDGLEFMRTLLNQNKHFQFIVLTGYGDVKTAVEAMKCGAYDFLEKPFSTEHLLKSLYKANDKLQLLQENIWLKKELDMQTHVGPKMIGHSQVMVDIRRALISAPAQQPIIFLGEAGTGKRLAAQFTHDIHAPPEAELITLSSEDWQNESQERLYQFLDDLPCDRCSCSLYIYNMEHMTLEQWQSLLAHPNINRVLGSASSVSKAIEQVTNVIRMPTLDQRKEDIGPLYRHFVRHATSRYQLQPQQISLEEIQELSDREWPENIKQLRQFAELRALKPNVLYVEDWQQTSADIQSMAQRIEYFEYGLLFDALQRHRGRLKDVQLELKLSRKTLYDKLKKHQLDKAQFKGRH